MLPIHTLFENPNVGPQRSSWKGGARCGDVHSRREVREEGGEVSSYSQVRWHSDIM
jgi:hypothetical protein